MSKHLLVAVSDADIAAIAVMDAIAAIAVYCGYCCWCGYCCVLRLLLFIAAIAAFDAIAANAAPCTLRGEEILLRDKTLELVKKCGSIMRGVCGTLTKHDIAC